MKQKLIQPIHIYILLMLSSGFMVHVLVLPNILITAKRDAWISVLLGILPLGIMVIITYYLTKALKDNSLVEFLQKKYPPIIFKFLSIIFAFFLISEAFVTLKYTVIWTKATYALDVPNFVIIVSFTIICYYASMKGIRVIGIIGALILPLVVILGFAVGLGNIPHKDYTLLFPVFEKGFKPVIHGVLYVCTGVFEIILILFLKQFTKGAMTYKGISFISFILIGLTLGPLSAAIAEFGSVEAAKLSSPAYEEWRILSLGRFINHVDFFSIFQWFSGAFIRVSLFLFLANELLFYRRKKIMLSLWYVLLIGVACINWSSLSFYHFMQQFYFPFTFIFLIGYTFISVLLVKIKSR
ncbi:endospore germination permease [Bacillus thuringiensis]|uniref:GerAB/ArcD/ProY family transporter n=1 Tax=Bacillus thuringiensis TaxID=1428 RepID=UPI002E18EA3D|nr:endospore germination permease [Bacillus thuringiensis]MEC5308495.1 endospore germination permease [Bacillus thuringiensis]